ncbi:testis-expressed protein 48 [Phyllostomus discolor]|uniref:Testis-expressed protein 48 n=1 Tax=Phyllostomus discolor TaxID=89673 RepID=A0A7E6D9Y1_9CHIR|nr:testis-expressed protein 48 [Phyllostomus discolor]
MALTCSPPTAAHRKLASKIFCLCCRDCEEPHSTDDSTIPSETQEQQTGRYQISSYGLCTPASGYLKCLPLHHLLGACPCDHMELSLPGVRKLQLDQQNPKYANKASGLALRQPLAHPEKDSTSSSDFEDMNTECPQRGFYKRNLDRYSQNHWPFQPCLIGRP